MADGKTLPLEEAGLWVERIGGTVFRPRVPALFLDRDGTINEDTGYPSDPTEIRLLPDILPIIRAANSGELPVVIVTNQSGIARGYFDWQAFAAVNARVIELLREQGCAVDLVVACAYHDTGVAPYAVPDHPMRKPNPGMLQLAAERLGIDLHRSVIVGDKTGDMQAGQGAGLAAGWLVGVEGGTLPGFIVNRLATAEDGGALIEEIDRMARRSA